MNEEIWVPSPPEPPWNEMVEGEVWQRRFYRKAKAESDSPGQQPKVISHGFRSFRCFVTSFVFSEQCGGKQRQSNSDGWNCEWASRKVAHALNACGYPCLFSQPPNQANGEPMWRKVIMLARHIGICARQVEAAVYDAPVKVLHLSTLRLRQNDHSAFAKTAPGGTELSCIEWYSPQCAV